MKPRTKRQILVCGLSIQLPKLGDKLEPWAFKNCINHVGYRNKLWTHCLSCSYVWPTTSMIIQNEVCPGCGWKLKLETTRKQKNREWARFAVLDVIDEYQVIRYFDINCHMKSARKPSMYTREIMQHWILPSGDFEIISCQVGGMGLSYDHFVGDMTLKTSRDMWKYNIPVYKIFPEMKLLPIFKRNGLTSKISNVRPFSLLTNLASDSKTETLLKTKQYNLLNAYLGDRSSSVARYWSSVKICIRSGYIVKEAITYLDYLDLLNFLGKDLRNSKFVCPKNLKREHDRLVKKRVQIIKRQDLERQKLQAEMDQRDYEHAKSMFFGLLFNDNDLEIKVLESIQEFIVESDIHKHCVYSNRYYKKEDSLIFSARLEGRPIETIEISLSKMGIVQSRGLQNKASEYHKQIIDLMNKNLNQIAKRYKEIKKAA